MWPPRPLCSRLALTTIAIAFQRMRLLMRRSKSRSPGYGGSASTGMVLMYRVLSGLRNGPLDFKFTPEIPADYIAIYHDTNSSTMKLLELTLPTPAENLACDEALLDLCEADSGNDGPSATSSGSSGILRFWEAREHFIVLGYSYQARTEAHLDRPRQ